MTEMICDADGIRLSPDVVLAERRGAMIVPHHAHDIFRRLAPEFGADFDWARLNGAVGRAARFLTVGRLDAAQKVLETVRLPQPVAKYNPNHYGPGPRGGQFAPAGEGSDNGAAPASDHTLPHAQTAQEILFGRVPLFLDEPPVEIPPPLPEYPTDPTKPPGPGFEWKGKNPVPGSREGSWYNKQTKQQLRPDLDHPPGVEPHWDYEAPDGKTYRWYPDGHMELKL